ncbi:bile acid:sodium symporter family protein [Magnetovibrio sp. PR-2]|uniref:bile acid:sodium symporter family protein n=1 Tax=Magnetovibrio sp. PR-2 TaxID=3120356 RepID=UPI002FCE1A7E
MDILLPLGLGLIMFAIGLGLTVADFTRIVRHPRAIVVGLLNQIVLLPMIGLAVLVGYDGRVEFAVGVMILAASPGGITSNLLTILAGGSAALSVSMTAITSVLSVVTVPLILGLSQVVLLGEGQDIHMPIGQIMGSVILVTAVPIGLGMVLFARWPDLVQAVHMPARRAATGIFAIIVVSAFIGQMDNIVQHFAEIGPRLIALNIATMGLGLFTALSLGLGHADRVAIAMECGLQNAALAIFVAVTVLGNPVLVVPAITYALIMSVTAAGLIAWVRRTKKTVAAE